MNQKELEEALESAGPEGLQLFVDEDEREYEDVNDGPLHIKHFTCGMGKDGKATYCRAMLAATMPAGAQQEFIAIPIRTNAGVSGSRMYAIGRDGKAQFRINMKTLQITWLAYDNSHNDTGGKNDVQPVSV